MNKALERQPSALQRLIVKFRRAFAELGCEATSTQLEAWSVLVHESMSGRGRRFHTVEHLFEVSEGAPPLETLALLFHDAVYCQVDGGLPPPVQSLVGDTVDEEQDHCYSVRAYDEAGDPLRTLVLQLFGFVPGQTLSPYGGLNEFLSALLAVRALEPLLSRSVLAQIACCIEATIPFRSTKPNGETPADVLSQRLAAVNQRYALSLDDAALERAVERAVEVANRDVGNFAAEDTARFLDNTWKLLPETNNSLRGQRLYTVREYRIALGKMTGFLTTLPAERVFRAFKGHPSDADYAEMCRRAARNLSIGGRYLRAKLLVAGLLESLAEATGGDAPIVLFMGDLPEPDAPPPNRLEEHLPGVEGNASDVDPLVLRLMEVGRTLESGFDLKTAPLAAHAYRLMGDAAVEQALSVARQGFADPARHSELLAALPPLLVANVARAAGKVAITRAEALEALAAERLPG